MLPPIANDHATIDAMNSDTELSELRRKMFQKLVQHRYSYNFTWYGRPIIQLPDDILAVQEIVLATKPDLIIETGVAHGGSLVFLASLLQLLGQGNVVGVDIEIRPHNRQAIQAHPLVHRIKLIEGSSTDTAVVTQVGQIARQCKRVMVMLDSDHTHEHVLNELIHYSTLVTKGCYLIVFDTAIAALPAGRYPNRPWGPDNNPKTAVHAFMDKNNRFEIDHDVEAKLLFTVCPDGFLRCVRD